VPRDVFIAALPLYIGAATYALFGFRWTSALKGGVAIAWAVLEMISVWGLVVAGYAVWLVEAHPAAYYMDPFALPVVTPAFAAPPTLRAKPFCSKALPPTLGAASHIGGSPWRPTMKAHDGSPRWKPAWEAEGTDTSGGMRRGRALRTRPKPAA
jgi:hypothetical protein